MDLIVPLGDSTEHKLSGLDDKFWFWETLETAIRPKVRTLGDDQIVAVAKAFAANYKGSEEMWADIYNQIYLTTASPY